MSSVTSTCFPLSASLSLSVRYLKRSKTRHFDRFVRCNENTRLTIILQFTIHPSRSERCPKWPWSTGCVSFQVETYLQHQLDGQGRSLFQRLLCFSAPFHVITVFFSAKGDDVQRSVDLLQSSTESVIYFLVLDDRLLTKFRWSRRTLTHEEDEPNSRWTLNVYFFRPSWLLYIRMPCCCAKSKGIVWDRSLPRGTAQ